MTTFWLFALGLLALALLILLPPLLRARAAPAPAASTPPHLAILREQLAQLDAELAAGTLEAQAHRTARAEIERRALDEEGDTPAPQPVPLRPSRRTAFVLGLAFAALSVSLYGVLGNTDALRPEAAGTDAPTLAQVEAMVAQMAQRLENPPDGQVPDANAWEMLGRSYAALQRFAEADRAYARAIALAPKNAQLLADRADVLTMAQGQSAAGEPTALVMQALAIDPRNVKALALAGAAALERGDVAAARRYWSQARALADAGGEFAAALDRSLAQLPAGGGDARAAAPPAASAASKPAAPAPGPAAGAAGVTIIGTVRIAPELAGRVAPDDTVFVFARATQGPRMPVAVQRYRARDLPVRFTLDDSSAMTPQARLSLQSQVVVSARVSRSGNALPQAGDLVGQSEPLAPGGAPLTLTIDRVQP